MIVKEESFCSKMLLQNLPEAANRVGANLRTILAQQLNMQKKRELL